MQTHVPKRDFQPDTFNPDTCELCKPLWRRRVVGYASFQVVWIRVSYHRCRSRLTYRFPLSQRLENLPQSNPLSTVDIRYPPQLSLRHWLAHGSVIQPRHTLQGNWPGRRTSLINHLVLPHPGYTESMLRMRRILVSLKDQLSKCQTWHRTVISKSNSLNSQQCAFQTLVQCAVRYL
jgi:hypothetical protein